MYSSPQQKQNRAAWLTSYLLSDPGGHREEPENRQGLRGGAQGWITLQLAIVPHSPRRSLGVSRATCVSLHL